MQKNKRSMQSIIINGIEIAHSCKNHLPFVYWYFVKRPCGGWTQFDVRELANHARINFAPEAFAITHDAFRLKLVAEFAATVDIHAFIDKQIADAPKVKSL